MIRSRFSYAATIFLAALLLFFIEPVAAKELLPLLGGASAVWVTCLVFFQLMLLIGYGYAHWLTLRLSAAQQANVHCVLLTLAAAVALIQASIPLSLRSAVEHPAASVFLMLGATVGLPVIMLAATGPLLQAWLSRQQSGRIPYKMFALGNAGSLLALALYPTTVEPTLTLRFQRVSWAVGFIFFAILCGAVARSERKSDFLTPDEDEALPGDSDRPSSRKALWFLLPMIGGIQLSAVTEHLTQNVATIPLLWLAPLAAYLMTFILAFDAPSLYRRSFLSRLSALLLGGLGYMLTQTNLSLPIAVNILFYLLELFVVCYFFHAETYALRPQRRSAITHFYLAIAAGGVAGSFLIGIVCPLLFSGNYDLTIAFALSAIAAIVVTWSDDWGQRMLWGTEAVLLCVLVFLLHTAYQRNSILLERNFYGSLRVTQSQIPPQATVARTLLNGSVRHGGQWFAPEFRHLPTTYYARDSGIGLTLDNCCVGRHKNVGVIGLGAGTLAAYSQAGDRFMFYDVNPLVQSIAQNLFTYLRDSPAKIDILTGDARTSLTDQPVQHFDVLVIDAFSGDAIPVHLLTKEAVDLYRKHLAPGGILAFHISNQYLDLAPEISLLARAEGMQARLVHSLANESVGESSATWALVTDSAAFFGNPKVASFSKAMPVQPGLHLWTDEYSSLLPLLRWK
jgi:hypothetical protein